MSKKQKLLDRIKGNQKGVRFQELVSIMKWKAWELNSSNSSHFTFKHKNFGRITIPKNNNQVKEFYVKEVLKKMGEI